MLSISRASILEYELCLLSSNTGRDKTTKTLFKIKEDFIIIFILIKYAGNLYFSMRSKSFSGTKSPDDIERHVARLTRQFDGATLKNCILCFPSKPTQI